MLGLEIMSLFLLGLLGAALPAAGSGDDDDEDKSKDDGADPDAPAPAAEEAETEGEGASLLDYAEDEPELAARSAAVEDEGVDPWEQEAEDAAFEDELDEADEWDADAEWDDEELEADTTADLDVLAAIARLTAASPVVPEATEDESDAELAAPAESLLDPLGLDLPDETDPAAETGSEDTLAAGAPFLAEIDLDAPDEPEDDSSDPEVTLAALEPFLAGTDLGLEDTDETDAESTANTDAPEDTEADDFAEDEDTAPQAPGDLSATTIVDYQPGSDQIEITIFAPAPDTAVDVVLQQTADGTGTEVLIDGKLRAILDGVLPGDVDANDLYIEFAG